MLLNFGWHLSQHVKGWTNIHTQHQDVRGHTDRGREEAKVYREMHDLVGFTDQSVDAIYTVHTLQQASVGDALLQVVLWELNRVLKPGGWVVF